MHLNDIRRTSAFLCSHFLPCHFVRCCLSYTLRLFSFLNIKLVIWWILFFWLTNFYRCERPFCMMKASVLQVFSVLLPLLSAQVPHWGPCPQPSVQPSFQLKQVQPLEAEYAQCVNNVREGETFLQPKVQFRPGHTVINIWIHNNINKKVKEIWEGILLQWYNTL